MPPHPPWSARAARRAARCATDFPDVLELRLAVHRPAHPRQMIATVAVSQIPRAEGQIGAEPRWHNGTRARACTETIDPPCGSSRVGLYRAEATNVWVWLAEFNPVVRVVNVG